jgi:uncharacterized membrane protein
MNKKIFIYIILLATLVRSIGLISRPIWYDEAFAILFAEKGFSAMLYGTLTQTSAGSADIHPLGYYTALWGWMHLFGQSIISARIFSILISLISLCLVYQITKKTLTQRTALFASGIFAILPFQIHFAQEIRMYSMLSLWLLLATFSFLKTQENKKWWILFSASCTLAQYTHNLAAIYLIPLSLTPIFYKDWKTLRNLILASLVSLILYLPWLIHLPAQLSKVNSHYWVEKPGLEKIFTLILFFLPHLPLPDPALIIGLLLAVCVIAVVIFQTYLGIKNKIQSIQYGLWLAYLSIFPPLLLWAVSQLIPVYIERALLPSHAIFCIWLAWALTETKLLRIVQSATIGIVIVCASMGFYQHLAYEGFPYGKYNEVNQYIQNQMEAGDIIVHSNKLTYLPSFYFNKNLPQGFIIDTPNSNTDTLAPATREILQLTEYHSIKDATNSASRIWFIIYEESINEYILNSYPTHPHIDYLDNHFSLVSIKQLDSVQVFLYQKISQ